MNTIEKRIVLDEATERVFQYVSQPQPDSHVGPGLLEVRDVHRLIDGVSYMNRVYSLVGTPPTSVDIQLDFEADQSALTTRLRDLDLIMTWSFQSDRLSAPRLMLDGAHTYWSPC